MEVAPTSPSDAIALDLYATWGKRFGAWLIDAVLLWATILLFSVGIAVAGSTAWITIVWFLSPIYFTLCHGSRRGQTLGKRVVGIAVRRGAGLGRVGYPRAFARWLVTVLFWVLLLIPGLLDALSPLWDAKRLAWHDKAVGSVVIQLY